jgi:hypothetical protein
MPVGVSAMQIAAGLVARHPGEETAMTAILGYVPPTGDVSAIGVHSLDQFVLSVPDLKTAQH